MATIDNSKLEKKQIRKWMHFANYANNKVACDELGIYFEHLVRPCANLFELPNGDWLPLGLALSIHAQFDLRQPSLVSGALYFLEEILGADYWNRLNEVHRDVAWECVKYLIEEENLPLVPVCGSKEVQVYRLK